MDRCVTCQPSRSQPASGPPALTAWMTSVLEPLIVELGTSRQRIEDLARENGRQGAELERAASIAVTLSDELEAVKAENRALEARTAAQSAEPTPEPPVPRRRLLWPVWAFWTAAVLVIALAIVLVVRW